jgi:hypothetical protein
MSSGKSNKKSKLKLRKASCLNKISKYERAFQAHCQSRRLWRRQFTFR